MQHRPIWYLNRVLQKLTGWILLPANEIDSLVVTAQHQNARLVESQDLLEQILRRGKERGGTIDLDEMFLGEGRRLH